MMEAFRRLTAVAAPIPIANIDTDMLVPAAFLKTVSRKGLGKALFHASRFDREGRENPAFILNRAPWTQAGIIIARDNFGCGSSREHAPWALLDFGIRCVIAPSFAEIFQGNCFKNGILAITLPEADIEKLLVETAVAETARLCVDLDALSITPATGAALSFSVDPQRRERLLFGLDDIALSLTHLPDIARYEDNARLVPSITADLLA